MNSIHQIFFSPSGTTKQVSHKITSSLAKEFNTYDLLKKEIDAPINFGDADIVVVSMPVFAGRIPKVCNASLTNIHGNDTLAIACVVYGNRDYDDALLELTNILEKQGFRILAAAAFIGQHSIFSVAKGRPDKEDLNQIEKFAKKSLLKSIALDRSKTEKLPIKGDHPYTAHKKLPYLIFTDESCTACGDCAKICPVMAIDAADPKTSDLDKCITCTACITVCPQKAKRFAGAAWEDRLVQFVESFSSRKEPEYYL